MNEWKEIEKLIVGDSEKMGMIFKDEFWNEMENILDESDAIPSITPLHGNVNSYSAKDGLFQEEYWDEMSLILDNEDKKKRRELALRWVFDIAAILLLMFMVIPSNSAIDSTKETGKLIASKKTEKDKTSASESYSDETNQMTPENSTTEIGENTSIQTGQSPVKEKPALVDDVQSRMIKTVLVGDKDKTLLSTNLFEDISNVIPKMGTKQQECTDPIATYPPISVSSTNPSIVRQIEPVNSKAFNQRSRIRPISLQFSLASNVALAPKGNILGSSRIGSSNTFGFEVLKNRINWSYGLGINVSHRTGINHEILLTRSTYGARLYRDYQSVTYKSINSIGIPVGVSYHRERNVFGLRITPTWNLMVNSTYHRYNNYNADELLVKNNYGIKEGINPFDLKCQLMYQRRFSEKLSAGISVSTGIINQIDRNLIPDTKGLYDYSIGLNVNYTLLNF